MADTIISVGRHGRIRGQKRPDGTCRYLGIPYAHPPIGHRRWKKPEPLPAGYTFETGNQPMDCASFKGVCPQEIYEIDGAKFNDLKGAAEFDEDCLMLNIWTPAEKLEDERSWPVLVFIHGGWLQIGSPSVADHYHPYELFPPEGDLQFVVVSIGYRLNAFGFLAGEGVQGNYGFWDQRAGLEWVQKNIHHFGGDANKVTLGGLSAGAFSTHTQLQYELLHTDGSKPLFKNVILYSNAIPAQPKTQAEVHSQFEELCDVLGVSNLLPAAERLDMLRSVPAEGIVAALPQLKMSNFRAVTDEDMIHADMMDLFQDGTFAKIFAERGYRLMTGETENEQYLYSRWLPPRSIQDLPIKLQNYYSEEVVKKLLAHPGYDGLETVDMFSRMVSDMQVRAPIRNLCKQLVENGAPSKNILRYRVAWRPKFFDDLYPEEAGVTHGADQYMWWGGKRFGYTDEEWKSLKEWLGMSLRKLVYDEDFEQATDLKSYLLLGPDGKAKVVEDQYWDHLMSVMDAISK